ncbi:uncharacterized protein BDZ99DRAFT_570211 [Mytilinidion resinicola]|uniref:Uncharacterized protein n=1 Tax=Mytilinidion resinicola TaxID=574789 RepID=A0A6A6YQ52_9PEZI|nr:uncharacterized protein BDZ99DRAFT_570211 [Mytilinidion resinicola]KAF2810920.1 hypothetical protein BDZ99DRAFT_570211 [Mytilinidion resinicola]
MPLANKIQKFKRYMGLPVTPQTAPVRRELSRPQTAPTEAPTGFRRIFRGRTYAGVISTNQSTISAPIAIGVIAFADQITAESLSHFLIWLFYYDVVELPVSPADWYKHLPSMEMRGWIQLGTFLQTTTPAGFQLARLDSIIDQLQLRKHFVMQCIDKISKPDLMRWSDVATDVKYAIAKSLREKDHLELVKTCLEAIQETTVALKPRAGTNFEGWQTDVTERIADYLSVIVKPRLSTIKGGIRVLSDKSEDDERSVRYIFEAMQAERPVPLVRYGIFPTRPLRSSNSSQLSVISPEQAAREADEELHYSMAQLRNRNKDLRLHVEALQAKNEELLANRPLPQPPSRFQSIMTSRKPVPDHGRQQPVSSGVSLFADPNPHVLSRLLPTLPADEIEVHQCPKTSRGLVPMPPPFTDRKPSGDVPLMIPDRTSSKPASLHILSMHTESGPTNENILAQSVAFDVTGKCKAKEIDIKGKGRVKEIEFDPYPTDSLSSNKKFIPAPLFSGRPGHQRSHSLSRILDESGPSTPHITRRRSKSANRLERPRSSMNMRALSLPLEGDRGFLPSQERLANGNHTTTFASSSGSGKFGLSRGGIRGVSGRSTNGIGTLSHTPSGSVRDRPRYDTEFLPQAPCVPDDRPTSPDRHASNSSSETYELSLPKSTSDGGKDRSDIAVPSLELMAPAKRGEKRHESGDGMTEFRRSSGLMGGHVPFFGSRNVSGGHRDLSRLG